METWAEYSRHALENHIPLATAARDFHARHGNPSPWEAASSVFHTKLGGFLSDGYDFPEALRRAREGGENPSRMELLWQGKKPGRLIGRTSIPGPTGDQFGIKTSQMVRAGKWRSGFPVTKANPSTDNMALVGLVLGIAGLAIAGRVFGGASCGTCAAASQQPPPLPTMAFYPGGSR